MEKYFSLFQKYRLIFSNEIYEYLQEKYISIDELERMLSSYKHGEDLLGHIMNYKNIEVIDITVNSTQYINKDTIYIHPIGFTSKNISHPVFYENFEILFKQYGNMEQVFEHLHNLYKKHKLVIIYGLIYRTQYKNIIFINELESGEFQFDLRKFEFKS